MTRRLDAPLTIADPGEGEFIALFRRLSPDQRRVVVRFALRHMNGVPFAAAIARLGEELARVRPSSGRPA